MWKPTRLLEDLEYLPLHSLPHLLHKKLLDSLNYASRIVNVCSLTGSNKSYPYLRLGLFYKIMARKEKYPGSNLASSQIGLSPELHQNCPWLLKPSCRRAVDRNFFQPRRIKVRYPGPSWNIFGSLRKCCLQWCECQPLINTLIQNFG